MSEKKLQRIRKERKLAKRHEQKLKSFNRKVDTVQELSNQMVDNGQEIANRVVDSAQALTTSVGKTVMELEERLMSEISGSLEKLKADQLLMVAIQIAQFTGNNSFLQTWNLNHKG